MNESLPGRILYPNAEAYLNDVQLFLFHSAEENRRWWNQGKQGLAIEQRTPRSFVGSSHNHSNFGTMDKMYIQLKDGKTCQADTQFYLMTDTGSLDIYFRCVLTK